jgi:thiamine-phosphate pyrophosphorylase
MLAAAAARLNRDAGCPPIPSLYFFTDPERVPDPVAAVRRLPRGAAIVYRHFGAPERKRIARQLAELCQARGLTLLVGADPGLAEDCGADGVHWPERLAPKQRGNHFRLVTGAAHNARALRHAERAQLDACVLSPVFPTKSASAHAPLGLFRASWLARRCAVPVIALGGVNARNAHRLIGRGFAGLAAVEALIGD